MRDGAAASAGAATRVPALLAGLLAVALAVFVEASLPAVRYFPGADEGHYLSYARTLSVGGPAALAQATRDYLDAPDAGIFPPPTRVGFLLPAALALRICGDGFDALSQVSLGAHLALIVSSFVFARRRLGAWPALGLAVLLGCSPLLLGLARRALADALVTLLLALAFWTLLEVLRPRNPARRRGWLVAFGFALAAALLAKESAVLFLVPLAAVALFDNLRAAHPVPWSELALAGLVPLLAAAAVWTALAGSPAGVFRLATAALGGPAHNTYAVAFGSGPWTRYLVDFLLLSPWSALLAVAGAGTLVLRRVPDEPQRALARDGLLFGAAALAAFAPLTKNVRYLAVLEIPLALLVLLFLGELLVRGRGARERRRGALLFFAAVLLLALAGLHTFEKLFVGAGIYDPVTDNLLRAEEMVPAR